MLHIFVLHFMDISDNKKSHGINFAFMKSVIIFLYFKENTV